MNQKRIAAIHDISCFGRCSLTVALPLISAAGIETAVIPTAVLSTHTGGFTGYTFRDLTDDILPIAQHWQKEGIKVDAVYSGYLGSKEQIRIVSEALGYIKKDGAIFIADPAMADNGKLYGGFPEDFPNEMKKLCAIADIITPNITEACFMLGIPYKVGPYTEDYVNQILDGLENLNHGSCVLTGVHFDDEKIGAACRENGKTSYVFAKYIHTAYHGTGDVFSSVMTAAYLRGKTLVEASQIACNFTSGCIEYSMIHHPDDRYGVDFESAIPKLLEYLR